MTLSNIINRLIGEIRIVLAKLKGMKISNGVQLGRNLDITYCSNISVGGDSIIYKNVTIYNSSKGSLKMGSHSHIAPYGYFLIADNKVEIGNDVAIGPFCSFFCHSNSYSEGEPLFRKNYSDADIKIGSNVFIGAQCVFMAGCIVEDNVIIAANSVVKGRLESGFIYGGSPAVKIKSIA